MDSFKEGNLVIIQDCPGPLVLCLVETVSEPLRIREASRQELEIFSQNHYENIFVSLEGKTALIVKVIRNLLAQPIGYSVLLEGKDLFCKSKVADKYFDLVENYSDESGGLSKV